MSGVLNRTSAQKRAIRDRMMVLQGGRCHYCRSNMTIGVADPERYLPTDATFDHLVPRAHGGRELRWRDNVVLACRQCNTDKGTMTAREFIESLPDLLQGRAA